MRERESGREARCKLRRGKSNEKVGERKLLMEGEESDVWGLTSDLQPHPLLASGSGPPPELFSIKPSRNAHHPPYLAPEGTC